MKVRYKKTGGIAWSSRFNTSCLGEVLTEDDSPFISELDVQLPSGEWIDMREAFRKCLIVPDNLNVSFAVPVDEEAKKRGYNP